MDLLHFFSVLSQVIIVTGVPIIAGAFIGASLMSALFKEDE